MGINTDCILMTNVTCANPELIQICAGAEETELFTQGFVQTGIAINTMTVCLQIPDVISPMAHYWMSI